MANSENKRNKAYDMNEEMEINDAVINIEAVGRENAEMGRRNKG